MAKDLEMILAAMPEEDAESNEAVEEMADACYQALKDGDKEAFKDALLGLLGL